MDYDNPIHISEIVRHVKSQVLQELACNGKKKQLRLKKSDIFNISLYYAQFCIDREIMAEDFTATFLHLYSALNNLNKGTYNVFKNEEQTAVKRNDIKIKKENKTTKKRRDSNGGDRTK